MKLQIFNRDQHWKHKKNEFIYCVHGKFCAPTFWLLESNWIEIIKD